MNFDRDAVGKILNVTYMNFPVNSRYWRLVLCKVRVCKMVVSWLTALIYACWLRYMRDTLITERVAKYCAYGIVCCVYYVRRSDEGECTVNACECNMS